MVICVQELKFEVVVKGNVDCSQQELFVVALRNRSCDTIRYCHGKNIATQDTESFCLVGEAHVYHNLLAINTVVL